MKRKPLCIIKACNKRGARRVKISIDKEQSKTVWICKGHYDLLNTNTLQGFSIGIANGP